MTDIITAPPALDVRRLAGQHRRRARRRGRRRRASATRPWAQVRAALLRHKVVFLRDQHLDYDRQVAFAQRLGSLTLGHPTLASPPGQPFLEEIDSRKRRPGEPLAHRRDVRATGRPRSRCCTPS